MAERIRQNDDTPIVVAFASPSAGRVFVKGPDVTSLPPEERDIGLLFQS